MPAEAVLRAAPVVVGFGIARLQADCFIVVRDGFLMPAKTVLRVAPVAVGFGQVRLQADCLVVVRDGFFMPAEAVLRAAPVVVGFGITRLQADCFVAIRDGFLVPAEAVLRSAPVVVGFGITRLQADCLVVIRDGLLVPTKVVLRVAPVVVGFSHVRFQADCFVIGIYRRFKSIFLIFLIEIAYGKPSPSCEFLVGTFRDDSHCLPLFDSFFDVSTFLKQDGCNNSLVNRGCGWILLNVLRGSPDLVRVVMDLFGRIFQTRHVLFGLIEKLFDLDEVALSFVGVSFGRLYIPTRFGLGFVG